MDAPRDTHRFDSAFAPSVVRLGAFKTHGGSFVREFERETSTPIQVAPLNIPARSFYTPAQNAADIFYAYQRARGNPTRDYERDPAKRSEKRRRLAGAAGREGGGPSGGPTTPILG